MNVNRQDALYVLVAGPVLSKTDEQVHHISGGQLIRLYGVPPHLCVNYREGARYSRNAIFLRPRFDGDYSKIPEPGL